MIEVMNRQRRRKIDPKHWREFGEQALQAIGTTKENATIVFVSDKAIKELNLRFRGKDSATDVLSFPTKAAKFEGELRSHLGEAVVSVERAAVQAKAHGLSLENEISQLILHGLMHLAGYDHETDDGEMNRLELRLRQKLGIDA